MTMMGTRRFDIVILLVIVSISADFLLDGISTPFVQSFAPEYSLHHPPLRESLVTTTQQRPRLHFKLRANTLSYLDGLSQLPSAEADEQLLNYNHQQHDDELWNAPPPSTSDESSIIRIDPMTWNGHQIAQNAYRVNLPPQLLHELRNYADRMGITDMYRQLVVEGRSLPAGGERAVEFSRRNDGSDIIGSNNHNNNDGYNWMIQRPKSHWKSNMHWTSPADEAAHDDYLQVLSKGGFDRVLQAVGDYFELDALSAYHLSFIGDSHCEKGFVHADVNDSGRKAFNMIIPLLLQEQDEDKHHESLSNNAGELEIHSDDGPSCDITSTNTMPRPWWATMPSMPPLPAITVTGGMEITNTIAAACDWRQQSTSEILRQRMSINC